MLMNCSNNKESVNGQVAATFQMELTTVEQNKKVVLRDVNMCVDPGKICAVIGRSNTDLDAIWDFFNPMSQMSFSGTVEFCGHRYSDQSFLSSRIQHSFQGETMLKGFSVIENIYLTDRRFYSFHKKRAQFELKDCFARFSISVDPNANVAALTQSERSLMEIVRAFIAKPGLLVLRDVLAQMADEHQKIAMQIFRAMQKSPETAMLYLSSRYEEALQIAEKLIVIRDKHFCGEFLSTDVEVDPKPLMYCLSGWSAFNSVYEKNSNDMIGLLLEVHNAMESTTELKKVLEFLMDSIVKVFRADHCLITVLDDELRTSMVIGNESVATSLLLERIRKNKEELYKGIVDFRLPEAGELHHVFFSPILLNNELAGSILVAFYDYQSDVYQKRKILENFSREMAIAIETSRLVGKSVLLQESHHRIKNNLQIIVNLLYMQKISLVKKGYEISEPFDQLINQVKSIAVIHDLLSKDKLGKSIVNLKTIIKEIAGFYRATGISFNLQLENISVPYNKAATISLLVNELVANSAKHAFPMERSDRLITIICSSSQGNLKLIVRDNGVGFPDGEKTRHSGIGSSLIRSSVLKMKGTISEENANGASTEILLSREGIYE